MGVEIAESSWLTDYYTNPVAGTTELDSVDPDMLQWEYDDERGRMYVTLSMKDRFIRAPFMEPDKEKWAEFIK